MPQTLLSFALVLVRISTFFLAVPIFGWRMIPVRIRVAATVFLTIFFAWIHPLGIPTAGISPLKVILLLAAESIYGLALGLIVSFLFSVVRISGQIIERQMGMAMSSTLNPLTGETGRPLGTLMEMIFVLVFLGANGHHMLLLIISKSYEAFPAGTVPSIETLTGGVVTAGSTMLIASLRLAAPMLAAFMVLMVALALLARLVPEMNILFISMPARLGLGLLLVATFLPFIHGFVHELAKWMGKLLPL